MGLLSVSVDCPNVFSGIRWLCEHVDHWSILVWDCYLSLLSVQMFSVAYDSYVNMLIFKMKTSTAILHSM